MKNGHMNCLFVVLVLLFFLPATSFSEDLWGELLAKHVVAGEVDYEGMSIDSLQLDQYLDSLQQSSLVSMSEPEKLALYINGYNACTVRLILDNRNDGENVQSIKDIGGWFSSPWRIKFCTIAGTEYTLDEIEHEVIRPNFNDPRVHFALNCASKSCPKLSSTPYQAEILDDQLEEQTAAFINDSLYNYIEVDTLYLSKIFDWYEEDFPAGVYEFVRHYARGTFLQNLNSRLDAVPIHYSDYDWSLNSNESS